jgi:hypothetical protein
MFFGFAKPGRICLLLCIYSSQAPFSLTNRNYHTGPVSRLKIILIFLTRRKASWLSYRRKQDGYLSGRKTSGYLTGREQPDINNPGLQPGVLSTSRLFIPERV